MIGLPSRRGYRPVLLAGVDQAAKAMRDEEMLQEIEDFLEGFQPAHLPRHADRRGPGSLPGHPSTGGQGDSRPDAEWLQ